MFSVAFAAKIPSILVTLRDSVLCCLYIYVVTLHYLACCIFACPLCVSTESPPRSVGRSAGPLDDHRDRCTASCGRRGKGVAGESAADVHRQRRDHAEQFESRRYVPCYLSFDSGALFLRLLKYCIHQFSHTKQVKKLNAETR